MKKKMKMRTGFPEKFFSPPFDCYWWQADIFFYHCCIVRMRYSSMHQSNAIFCVSFSVSHFFGSGSAEFQPLSTSYLQDCCLVIDSVMSKTGISMLYLVHSFFIFTTRPTVWWGSDNAIISSYWKFLLS